MIEFVAKEDGQQIDTDYLTVDIGSGDTQNEIIFERAGEQAKAMQNADISVKNVIMY